MPPGSSASDTSGTATGRAPGQGHETVVVLDFGGQYTQLIARRVREQHVYCRILPCDAPLASIRALGPRAIVLSGGPASVWRGDSPRCDPGVFELGVPLLGLCYGMQLLCAAGGGSVAPSSHREFGRAALTVDRSDGLFAGMPSTMEVWMSHGDRVESLPDDFEVVAHTANAPFAAVRSRTRPVYGLQFHPEVVHTPLGRDMIRNFLVGVAGLSCDWVMSTWIDEAVATIRAQVGERGVICGLSGGVDSAVVAALVYRAIGERLTCIFVDNGLLRAGEAEEVEEAFTAHFGRSLIVARAADRFLSALAGVTEPERKRKIIGHEFIDVFKAESAHVDDVAFLAQGTLYPTSSSRSPRSAVRRPRSRPTTTSAGCRPSWASTWSSRCATCSRTRCARSAPSSGCRSTSSGATRSRVRGSRSAASARSPPPASTCSAPPTPSCSPSCARPGSWTRCGRRSA